MASRRSGSDPRPPLFKLFNLFNLFKLFNLFNYFTLAESVNVTAILDLGVGKWCTVCDSRAKCVNVSAIRVTDA